MIYSEDAVFIHVPKTGGMSITHFLVNALDCPVTVVAPANARDHSMSLADGPRAAEKLSHVVGLRHENSPEACELIRDQGWKLPTTAFATIRDPIDLMVSYYKHMRKPSVWKLRGMTADTLRGAPKLAMELPFEDFCTAAGFYGMNDEQLLSYYDPAEFSRMDIVPLPEISEYLKWRFGHHNSYAYATLKQRNQSNTPQHLNLQSDVVNAHITSTYPQMSQLYHEVRGKGEWYSQSSNKT